MPEAVPAAETTPAPRAAPRCRPSAASPPPKPGASPASAADSAAPPGLVLIGRIGGAYGIKGWVRVRSFTEPEEQLLSYRDCKLRQPGLAQAGLAERATPPKQAGQAERTKAPPEQNNWRDILIDAGRRHGKGLIAHIEGVDDRDAAAALAGAALAIAAAALPELKQGEYYWRQLLGLEVRSGGELLGRVDRLLETGGNDVLAVKPCPGSRDARERLLPWLPGSVIRAVDLQTGRIEADWDPEF